MWSVMSSENVTSEVWWSAPLASKTQSQSSAVSSRIYSLLSQNCTGILRKCRVWVSHFQHLNSRKPFETWGMQLFFLRKSEKIQTWFSVKHVLPFCIFFFALHLLQVFFGKVRLPWERCPLRTSLERSEGSSSRTPAPAELAERITRE